jgi:hypothetical protein
MRLGVAAVLMLATRGSVRADDVFDPYANKPIPVHDVEEVTSPDTSNDAFAWRWPDDAEGTTSNLGAGGIEPEHPTDDEAASTPRDRWIWSP